MDGISAKLSIPYSISAVIEESQNYYMHGNIRPSEEYTEDYEIETTFEDQVISTKGKYLRNNITIKKVPVSTVGNDSGGYTLNIGG